MNKFDQLRAAAASLEHLAADYHATLKPVHDALQAVADAPFDDREKWVAAVSALARRLAENGLGDVPASRQGAGRWAIQFDNGKPGNAFAGHAFFAALAAAIADGSSPVAFFTTLDQYSFVPRAAGPEVCAALSNLLYVHKERVAPRFTAAYKRMLDAVNMSGSALWLRLHHCDIRLPSDTLAAMHDWDECASGVAPCYTADIRPSQPVWAKAIDERVAKLCVDPPPDLDPELAEAFSAAAVGVRECTRLMDSVPYLWSNLAQYRRLAARVAESAAAARAAYARVDIRLRRAGGPNAMLEALNDVLTVHGRAPGDPDPRRDGLNAAITGLYTNRADLFARVDGKGVIDRMVDQLARVPPVPIVTVAAPSPADPVTTPGGEQPPEGLPAAVSVTPGAGEVNTKEITKDLKEFLATELARIGTNAVPPADPPPPPARVRCDSADWSVSLDGKRLATGLTPEQFEFLSAVVNAYPDTISFQKIKKGKTQGKNQTRIKDAVNKCVRGALPATHLDFIVAKDGVGYRLNLPPAKRHE